MWKCMCVCMRLSVSVCVCMCVRDVTSNGINHPLIWKQMMLISASSSSSSSPFFVPFPLTVLTPQCETHVLYGSHRRRSFVRSGMEGKESHAAVFPSASFIILLTLCLLCPLIHPSFLMLPLPNPQKDPHRHASHRVCDLERDE